MGVKMGFKKSHFGTLIWLIVCIERKEKSPFRFFVPLLKDDHFCDRYTIMECRFSRLQ